MDELGFNKIAAAVLVTGLGVMFLREAPHKLMHTDMPETPAYSVGAIAVETGNEAAEPLPFPQANWIAAMDATRGAKVFKKCTSCHNAENGGGNSTGPNLWGIVGKASAQREGFKYSAAMKNAGLTWDYETLNDYLTKPTKYLSGTAMNFIGVKKEADRAAVIEYLRLASEAPLDQPAAAAAPEAALEELMEEMSVEAPMEAPAEMPMEETPLEEMPAETPQAPKETGGH